MSSRSLFKPRDSNHLYRSTEMAPLVVFASLLSLLAIAASQECSQELLKDVDFPGTDIKFIFAADENHCQQLCTQHSACLFFTFVRPDWTVDQRHFYCYLKSTPSKQPNSQRPLVGVTSGFSLKPCSSDPIYHDVDFPGADYKQLFTQDYQECERVCTHDVNCHFYTFITESFTTDKLRYKCHLKFSLDVPTTPIVEREEGLVSGFSHTIRTNLSDKKCEGQLFPITDIPGNDIQTQPSASAGHCRALCSAHPLCTHFTHNSGLLTCYLKRNTVQLLRSYKEGFTSGLPARFCQTDEAWVKEAHENVDFHGSDLGFEQMEDADACQRSCTSNPDCQFYTYVTQDFHDSRYRGRCYFKNSFTMPAPPIVAKLPHVVSGFSLRNRN